MTRVRIASIAGTWLLLWTAAVAQEQLSIRCATKEPDENERGRIDEAMRNFHDLRQVAGLAAVGGTVNVYVHVINKGTGIANGDVPDQQILEQMNVLTSAYGIPGFSFNLVGTDRTTNAAWYTMSPGSAEEKAAKTALRKGSAVDLNLYTANQAADSGWATFPSDYSRNPRMDGVVILYSSLPGGARFPTMKATLLPLGLPLARPLPPSRAAPATRRGGFSPRHAPEKSPAFGCPTGRDTCPRKEIPGLDPIKNFMDYTDDSHEPVLVGQDSRMGDAWALYRAGN
jgi:hypothetical protein